MNAVPPRDQAAAPDQSGPSARRPVGETKALARAVQWLMRHRVCRVAGFSAAGAGLGLWVLGLEPIGLTFLLLAAALLVAEFEPWLDPRFRKPPG